MNQISKVLLATFVASSFVARAQDASASKPATSAPTHKCTQGKLERRVEVVYEKADSKTPCKVDYVKDTSNPTPQQIFRAEKQEGFCEQKAMDFVEKLKSNGWTCE